MGEVKKTANWLKEHEKFHTTEANEMTPKELKKEIERMKKLSGILGPNGISTIRLTAFEAILKKMGGYGRRRAKEVRVRSTS